MTSSPTQVADDENRTGTCYKIGDLGLVTTVSDPVVEEGDVRYLPLEIMQEVRILFLGFIRGLSIIMCT